MLYPLLKLIEEDGNRKIPETLSLEVIPALMKKDDSDPQKLYFNPYDLTDWLPNAFMAFRDYSVWFASGFCHQISGGNNYLEA